MKPPSGGFAFGGINRKLPAALGPDVSSWALFGHGLNSEVSSLCEQQRTSAKATEFMGSRPSFLRLGRIVEHVLAEISLLPVGAIDGIAALGIAILAAGDIFG